MPHAPLSSATLAGMRAHIRLIQIASVRGVAPRSRRGQAGPYLILVAASPPGSLPSMPLLPPRHSQLPPARHRRHRIRTRRPTYYREDPAPQSSSWRSSATRCPRRHRRLGRGYRHRRHWKGSTPWTTAPDSRRAWASRPAGKRTGEQTPRSLVNGSSCDEARTVPLRHECGRQIRRLGRRTKPATPAAHQLRYRWPRCHTAPARPSSSVRPLVSRLLRAHHAFCSARDSVVDVARSSISEVKAEA